MDTAFDFSARYTVDGYRGVAWYAIGHETRHDEDYEWSGCETVDETRVVCIMVGDDRKFTFDADELTMIDDDDYCHECGQIGCTHDGRDRGE